MRILMIAPEPFFQPRGTPFSEYYRARAFTELGHEVDMVTYPIGSEVALPGLRVFRARRVPGIRSVRIGPSLPKLALDAALFGAALRRLRALRYDLLDCHEEAGLMGVWLSRRFGVPTIYDMHSSLPEQLANFRFSRSRLLRRVFERAERFTLRGSHAVIAICPHLQQIAEQWAGGRPCFLIENSPLAEAGEPVAEEDGLGKRRELGLERARVVLYTGTFEAYQGLDLLFAAMESLVRSEPRAHLVMVGGHPEQVEEAREEVRRRGIEGAVLFTGQRPPSEMSLFLASADVVVSPRSTGTNTPLKIYSYLRSGKPIVATRLLTHTQVLDDGVAELTAPEPQAFARGILAVLQDAERARSLGESARRRAEERYSYASYLEKTRRVLDYFAGAPAARTAAGRAASA